MAKMRYNRTFKNGIAATLFGFLLFGAVFVFSIVAKAQYDSLVAEMKSIEATIVDIDLDIHVRGPDEQEITITYEVDGVIYRRELATDTTISFAAGSGADYSVGDKIDIFYDPQDPNVIAAPRSVGVGYFWMVFSLIGLALVSYALFFIITRSHTFLVTQEEYEKEKEEIKKTKLAKKKQKEEKYGKAGKVGKVILLIFASLLGAFTLLGILLNALGY